MHLWTHSLYKCKWTGGRHYTRSATPFGARNAVAVVVAVAVPGAVAGAGAVAMAGAWAGAGHGSFLGERTPYHYC